MELILDQHLINSGVTISMRPHRTCNYVAIPVGVCRGAKAPFTGSVRSGIGSVSPIRLTVYMITNNDNTVFIHAVKHLPLGCSSTSSPGTSCSGVENGPSIL